MNALRALGDRDDEYDLSRRASSRADLLGRLPSPWVGVAAPRPADETARPWWARLLGAYPLDAPDRPVGGSLIVRTRRLHGARRRTS